MNTNSDADHGKNIRQMHNKLSTFFIKLFFEKIAKMRWYVFDDAQGEGDVGFSFFNHFIRFYKWNDGGLICHKNYKELPPYRLAEKREICAYIGFGGKNVKHNG